VFRTFRGDSTDDIIKYVRSVLDVSFYLSIVDFITFDGSLLGVFHGQLLRYLVFTARCTSASRGIEIVCRPSVRLSVPLSVCLSVCDVAESRSHRLETLETNCTVN